MQNPQNEKENIENKENPVLKKVSEILHLQAWEIETKKTWDKVHKEISRLLQNQEYASNKSLWQYLIREFWKKYLSVIDGTPLKNDKDIIVLKLRQDSNYFYDLTLEQQKDTKIAKEMIKSLVREWVNFFDIKVFLEKYYNKKEFVALLSFYKAYLEQEERVYKDDLSKILIDIERTNKVFFDLLKKKWVIQVWWKKISISSSFINDYLKTLENTNQNFQDRNAFEVYKLELLLALLWLKEKELDENSKIFIEYFLNLVNNKANKRQAKKEKIEEEELWTEEVIHKKPHLAAEKDVFEDRLDFCLPECSYYISGWSYVVETVWNKSVKLTQQEVERFNSRSLSNFVRFYDMMYSLWLNFLWDKYKSGFVTLLNNNIWFDYTSWEWFTESRILSVLNLIWKNIWIPEREIVSDTWESKKIIACFERLDEAKMAFWDINKTWKVNWETLSEMWMFSRWAVENMLILNWKLDPENSSVNISDW